MKNKIEKSEKTICFSREKFSESQNDKQNVDFSGKTRMKTKVLLMPRAGRPVRPWTGYCVFLCTPSLNLNENP